MRQTLALVLTPRARWLLALALLLASLASGASVALMGTSAFLLSRAAEQPPILYLMVAIVGVRFFGISRGVFRYLERLVGHDVALRAQSGLRLRVYDRLSRGTLLGRRSGDLQVRLNADVAAVQDLIVRVLLPFASAGLVVVGTTILLGRLNPAAGALLLVSALLAGGLVPWLARLASRRADRSVAPLRGELADLVRAGASAAVDLAAYGRAEDWLERTARVDARLRAAEGRAAWVQGLAAAVQVLAAGVAVVGALLVGVPAVAAGGLAPVNLAVLVLTPLALHEVLASLAQAAQTFTRARGSLERVGHLLAAAPVGRGDRVEDDHASGPPGVILERAALGWPGGPAVLTGVELSVGPGEWVALTGPSGVGKTTLAATVLGLIPPLGGRVQVCGRVGYLAQDAHIFDTSVAENVRIGDRDADGERIADALERAGLALEPSRSVGEHGTAVSGGEARRLALARVLLARRDVWVLDEPTEHLDADTAAALLDDLVLTAGDQPVLVITHDPSVMARCDRVVALGGTARG